mmetsp:Transcript_74218/g.215034  ORF Transcript_74218/g.215034 Transcript_74218/m.215034 type:complete len:264 (+) Transcript_74218:171-962(+)
MDGPGASFGSGTTCGRAGRVHERCSTQSSVGVAPSITRSTDPTARAKSVEERTPTTLSDDTTTKWWIELSTILAAHSCTDASRSTVRNHQSFCTAFSHRPTSRDKGTCSTKACNASRGVTMPTKLEALRPSSPTSAEFCLEVSMRSRASRNVAPGGQTTNAALGFMTSAAVLLPRRLAMPSCDSELQSARAKSKDDSTPKSSPSSSRTRTWRSEDACSRNKAAASINDKLGWTVMAPNASSGKPAASVRSQSPTQAFGSSPFE